jgi:hypothetical protein
MRPPGCQIGHVNRPGCHQLHRVLTVQNNVSEKCQPYAAVGTFSQQAEVLDESIQLKCLQAGPAYFSLTLFFVMRLCVHTFSHGCHARTT